MKQEKPIYYVNASVSYYKERHYGVNEVRKTDVALSEVLAVKKDGRVTILFPETFSHRIVNTATVYGKEVTERVFKGTLKRHYEMLQSNMVKRSIK